jgi:hypothetical protein
MAELHADMTVRDILKANPKAKDILFEFGVLIDIDRLKSHESLGEVCAAHNLSKRTVAEVVERLNMAP